MKTLHSLRTNRRFKTINFINVPVQLFFLLFIFSFLFLSCAPIPPIQSARVTGRAGLGVSYTSPSHQIEVIRKYTCGFNDDSIGVQTLTISDQFEPRGYLRFGIKNRVEIMTALPFIHLPYVSWGYNLKVALFDIGNKPLYQNISSALFIGGDIIRSEWDDYNNIWGGLIIGTHCPVKSSELELVFMTSGSHFSLEATSDGMGDEDISFATANFSLGCIFRPTKHRFLEMNIGVTGRTVISKHYKVDLSYSDVISSRLMQFKISPVVFQGGLQLYIPRKDK